jgi:hypothetical protein
MNYLLKYHFSHPMCQGGAGRPLTPVLGGEEGGEMRIVLR